MFIDKAVIKIKAGDGGNGAVAFHREKFINAGGPDWGASGSFETSVEEALDRYIISRSSNDGAVL